MSQDEKSTKHLFKAPAFQLYAKEFLQDEAVIAMELEAVGAYIILLCHQWTEGSIPADPALLARICRTTPERIEAIWPQLAVQFPRKESHNAKRLANRKLEVIRKERYNFNATQTQHGLNGAAARWHPERNGKSNEISDSDRLAHVTPMGSAWGSDSSGSGIGSGSEKVKNICASPDGNARVSVDDPPIEAAKPKLVDGLTAQQDSWFTEWWKAYWLRKARKPARKAFGKQCKTAARFAEIMAATRAQSAEMLGREPQHRPYGATWLNAERWRDEDLPPAAEVRAKLPEGCEICRGQPFIDGARCRCARGRALNALDHQHRAA
jgi:uncharacterized protein YdaU (DUF1376 family)